MILLEDENSLIYMRIAVARNDKVKVETLLISRQTVIDVMHFVHLIFAGFDL